MRCAKAEGGYSALVTAVNQLISQSMSLGKTVHYRDAVALIYDLLHCPLGSRGSFM